MGSKCCGNIKYIGKNEFILINDDEILPKEYQMNCRESSPTRKKEAPSEEYRKNNLKIIIF
jgi:hypothetical protein